METDELLKKVQSESGATLAESKLILADVLGVTPEKLELMLSISGGNQGGDIVGINIKTGQPIK